MATVQTDLMAGSQIGAFTVLRNEPLDALHGRYVEMTHEQTGARYIHIACPDDNKAFAVAFPTIPQDSTGVAHILEHVTLAGSKRFPIRDPFFSMLPRSLKTFMNAMTSSDSTMYPFSTRNEKDFYNLLDVYLDACFFPLLTEDAFMQEGHRFEFETIDDATSGLRYRGVVFNEMKAATSTPGRAVSRAIGRALMPDLTYSHESGGDPAVMPELTWEGLKAFQARHYHPSNAHFYTYGDLDVTRVVDEFETHVLSFFERQGGPIEVPDQPRFSAPVTERTTYPLAEHEDPAKRSQVLVAWLTTKVTDPFEVLALEVLSEAILGNAGAPLHHALISSGLGDALADGTGFSDGTREAIFAAGLKGVEESDADDVERIVLDTLDGLARDGVPADKVDAAIHQLEIAHRDISSNQGLRVLYRLVKSYAYGADAYRALQIDADIKRLEDERRNGPFFEDLIRRWMLDNPHRARIVVVPDQTQERRAREAEDARLAAIESGLTEDQKQEIVRRAIQLKERQESDSDVSVLPTLELSDVPADVDHALREPGEDRIARFALPTNGILYASLRSLLDSATADLEALPLLGYALPKIGAGDLDYAAMAARIDARTGGIGAGPTVRTAVDGTVKLSFGVTALALPRNAATLVDILRDMLSSARFEPKRIGDVLNEYRTRLEASIVGAGHQFATLMASRRLDPAAALRERLSGVTVVRWVKDAAAAGDAEAIAARLESAYRNLFAAGHLDGAVVGDDENAAALQSMLVELAGALTPPTPSPIGDGARPQDGGHEARTTAVPVAYNAKVLRAVPYAHPDAPALSVLAAYLRSTFLHREIRESGGAYGAYATYDSESGLFAFQSYRDPHIVRTFEVFGRAPGHVLGGPSADDVTEAILTVCGALDPALSPSMRARRAFADEAAGYTADLRRRFKAGVLAVTADDLVRATETYLSGDNDDRAALATISNPDKVGEANTAMGGIFEIAPI